MLIGFSYLLLVKHIIWRAHGYFECLGFDLGTGIINAKSGVGTPDVAVRLRLLG